MQTPTLTPTLTPRHHCHSVVRVATTPACHLALRDRPGRRRTARTPPTRHATRAPRESGAKCGGAPGGCLTCEIACMYGFVVGRRQCMYYTMTRPPGQTVPRAPRATPRRCGSQCSAPSAHTRPNSRTPRHSADSGRACAHGTERMAAGALAARRQAGWPTATPQRPCSTRGVPAAHPGRRAACAAVAAGRKGGAAWAFNQF